jgi:hypothetical protein
LGRHLRLIAALSASQIYSAIKVDAVARLTHERLRVVVHSTLPLTARHGPASIQMQC